MKTPLPPNDELLKSLVEEASALPQAAAAQARSRQRARMNIVRVAGVLALSLLALGIRFFNHVPSSGGIEKTAAVAKPSESPNPSKGYVKAYPVGEAEPGPIPPDTNERERTLLTELPGVPVLIVKNDAGEISRVHVFER